MARKIDRLESTDSASAVDRNGAENGHAESNIVQSDIAELDIIESDAELALLRDLILGSYQERIDILNNELADVHNEMDSVQKQLDHLDSQTLDEQKLLETINPHIAKSIRTSIQNSRPEMIEAISPIMADTIRTGIRDSRGEMVEALYPLVGQLVQRAVREAMKDLARRIDQQIQSRLSIARQFRALMTGVSPAELVLRESLPFNATDIFLIHRLSGLLLIYVNDKIIEVSPDWALDSETINQNHEDAYTYEDEEPGYDSDLISGMLTAIRDFVQDAFGSDENEELNQVSYGDKEILLETAEHAYIAVVVEGTQPAGFREMIRSRLIDIENSYIDVLRDYNGDASPFEKTKDELQSLLLLPEEQHKAIDSAKRLTTSRPSTDVAAVPETGQLSTSLRDQQPSNSTSLSPLSILLLINVAILLLWWMIR